MRYSKLCCVCEAFDPSATIEPTFPLAHLLTTKKRNMIPMFVFDFRFNKPNQLPHNIHVLLRIHLGTLRAYM